MKRVVGVRFRGCGKTRYFDPGDLDIRLDDGVIAETEKGLEFGTVALPKSNLPDELVPEELKPLVRKADEEDIERYAELCAKERESRAIFVEKVRAHELDMKLVDVECSFDGNRIIFYFSAEGRVDFRELVKDLAGELHMRIELRQIGVRDETRMLGGMGTCGRPLCCSLYLKEFAPVTIKMAKSQNLSLNPTKISGCCGRLMCCLRNEAEVYDELSKNLPKRGTVVTTFDGFVGVTVDSNILQQTVRVLVDLDHDEKEMREYAIEQLKFTPGIKRPVRKADQRPVARSVVAQAAKAEARKQAVREAEERAETAADGAGEPAEDSRPAEDPGNAGTEGREGGRRRRSRRRRERSGENAAQNTAAPAPERNENRNENARTRGGAAQERANDGGAEGGEQRSRRSRSRRNRSRNGNAEQGGANANARENRPGNRREGYESGREPGSETRGERKPGAEQENRPRRRRRRRPSSDGSGNSGRNEGRADRQGPDGGAS